MISRQILILGGLALLVLAPAGCGPSGGKLNPVSGTIMCQGKPAAKAIIFLQRKDRTDPSEPIPQGVADDDGNFVITTMKQGDGAMAGEYAVTVVWPDMSKPEDRNGMRPDLLKATYSKVAAPKLTAVVTEGKNTLPTLEIELPRK